MVADPGLAVLGAEVARRLREHGAVVALDASGSEPSVVAADANQFRADLFLALGTGAAPAHAARTSRPSTSAPRAASRSRRSSSAVLATVLPDLGPPVGRTYQVLRETRMAAVVCELYSRDDPAGATALTTLVPRLADAIVEGIRRGVEAPLDVTP